MTDSDDDFEYDLPGGPPPPGDTQAVANQPHDEEMVLSNDDSNMEDLGSTQRLAVQPDTMVPDPEEEVSGSLVDNDSGAGLDSPPPGPEEEGATQRYGADGGDDGFGSPGGTSTGGGLGGAEGGGTGGGGTSGGGVGAGGYKPEDYAGLDVTSEVRDLFQYIGRYAPQTRELDTPLKPFIPDYIPAVGDIDEFIKVPRPDGRPDFLGLKVLDEPAPEQSDATLLNIHLKSISKQANIGEEETMAKVEHSDDDKLARISQWTSKINEIHKKAPVAAPVNYSRPMPDIETLMQEWPSEMEDMIRKIRFPSGDVPLDLATFTKAICGLLDIPVDKNPIESLHVLFTLYLELKNNPYLQQGGTAVSGGGEANVFKMPGESPDLGLY